MLLGKRMSSTKERVDAEGNKLPDEASMPANGVETEYVPFQTFVRDFVRGQTYAVEVAYAVLAMGPSAPDPVSVFEYELLVQLVEQFGNADVYSMVGFAMKQTFDYVKRGERLNEALAVQKVLRELSDGQSPDLRLDDNWSPSEKYFDVVVRHTGLATGTTVNNNKAMRTLELNGRQYLETTRFDHLLEQLNKLVKSYGDRTNAASTQKVDYKSLSHAVRVYQQALELLDTGKLSFPRPNVDQLLAVKQGRMDLEDVKALLVQLDAEVQEKLVTSTQRRRTPELEAAAEQWLLGALRALYDLPPSA